MEKAQRPQDNNELRLFMKQLGFVSGKAKINLDVIDSDFRIRYIDPAWQKIYGKPGSRKCYEYFMGRKKICPNCGVALALKTKKVAVTEEVLVKENNRPIQVTTIPFRDIQDEWLVAEVNVDISVRKKAEEVLRRDKETLEQLVRARTDEMLRAERELNNAKRLADIGALAAIVAHELRNPLAVIKTATYNMKSKNSDPALVSHMRNIDAKIQECDQIINNLLFYSHIKVPKFKHIKICDILEECIAESRARFPKHRVLLHKRYRCPKGFLLKADPVQMEEVFNNLLSNAYESLKFGKGRIEILAEVKKDHFMVSIKDNGAGIEKTDLERIFEPFFTRKSKGIGLGLVVCQQIVSLHNGIIQISSKPAEGTTVTISLPASK